MDEPEQANTLQSLALKTLNSDRKHPVYYHTFSSGVDELQASLLKHYDAEQRVLPWRVPSGSKADHRSTDEQFNSQRAYEVWISEVFRQQHLNNESSSLTPVSIQIMLQQTKVDTVIAYYEKWMAKWPTLVDLAKATLEEVNQVWTGLGYYSRARRILEAAQLVTEKFNGELPRTAEELEKEIPGVGPYTAGAIASIAYNQPSPLVDGNVIRVLSRLRAISADPKSKPAVDLHWSLARTILSKSRPGHFNQALMDLGATICTPTSPSCTACPISDHCLALAELKAHKVAAASKFSGNGAAETWELEADAACEICLPFEDIEDFNPSRYPLKIKKKAARQEERVTCVLEHRPADGGESKYLVVQNPKKGMLANLWDFPSHPLPESSPKEQHPDTITALLASYTTSTPYTSQKSIGLVMHKFSHVHWSMNVYHWVIATDEIPELDTSKSNVAWWTKTEVASDASAVPKTLRKVWDAVCGVKKGKRKADDEEEDSDDGDEGEDAETKTPKKKAKKTSVKSKTPSNQKSITSFFKKPPAQDAK
ncbi:hypothetical protein SmJEL517_g05403 [Synchytrium microbalum]|uniref:Adenine DNA glycosylase n=1 Tax=Synchytrium microbalum TaxID=1806994 RepID=A0A507BZM5_9FUNG|nr:uncharacterized protein SmJEL517_g05403 [Synchytrium microbalum]TPX31196.1 hypothetical protein SmJEL517_g05403 [Synchytrium microbalum]